MTWAQRPNAAPFLVRLRQSPGFGADDLTALEGAPADIRTVEHHGTIIPEGRRDERLHVVFDGWAARVKIMHNGSRQIPALMLPGDVADLDTLHLLINDCSTVALTRCTVVTFARDPLLALFDRHRGLRNAMYRMMAIGNAVATQWTVSLGRHSARERLAHLLCELSVRLGAVGLLSQGAYTLPLTQEEMADVLGLTAVHVNRTLQGLRGEGLIQLRDQWLVINDWAALRRASGFDPAYLHMDDAIPTILAGRAIAGGTEARLGASWRPDARAGTRLAAPAGAA